MLERIVKGEGLALFPRDDLVMDADAAFFAVRRDDEPEMRAHDPLGDPGMGRDMIAGREDREPRGLHIRHAAQDFRRHRGLSAVLLKLLAKAVEDEGLPLLRLGDPMLVGGDLLEPRNGVAVLQHLAHLIPHRFPAVLEFFQEREMIARDHRRVRHDGGARLHPRGPAQQFLAVLLHEFADRAVQRFRAGGFYVVGGGHVGRSVLSPPT